MITIVKTSNRHYECIETLKDGTQCMLSRLFPSNENHAEYDGLCFGDYFRFKTVRSWRAWVHKTYGGRGAS